MEKQYKTSLVDSSIGSFDQVSNDIVGKVYSVDNYSNYISIEFDSLIMSDRAFEIAKLLFTNLKISKIIVLSEIESLSYISATPEERVIAPLLRMLSTNNNEEGNSICKLLESPNLIDGIPAALLSLVCFYYFMFCIFIYFFIF